MVYLRGFLAQESPKPIYEAQDFEGIWDLAKTEYPPDRVTHFFVEIAYMTAFYGFLHLFLHFTNNGCNKRY